MLSDAARFRVTHEPLELAQIARPCPRRTAAPWRRSSAWSATTTRGAASTGSITKLRAAGGGVVRADRRRGGRALAGARAWRFTIGSGRIEIGEASVVIAAASPHRADAFAACRYAIERVKQIAPIWKHEHFDGGEAWIEGATADPDGRGGASGGDRARMLVTIRLFARLREIAGAAELARELRTAPPPARLGHARRGSSRRSRDHARVSRARSTKSTRA